MIIQDLTVKDINKLNKNSNVYKFLKEQKNNEKNLQFIYNLKLQTGEEIDAFYERSFLFNNKCYIGFRVLKVKKKFSTSKIKRSTLLQFNEDNFPIDYSLIKDESPYTINHDDSKNKISYFMCYNKLMIYDKYTKQIEIHLAFPNWMQKNRINISPRDDLDIVLIFDGVENTNNIKEKDTEEWEIVEIKFNNKNVEILTVKDVENYSNEDIVIKSFSYNGGTLKLDKLQYLNNKDYKQYLDCEF